VVAQYPPVSGATAPLPRIQAAPRRSGNPLKGLGLVAIAVVSGLVWWLIRAEPAGTPVAQPPVVKEFAFALAEGPAVSTNCAANSTGQVRAWFAGHPCQRLARGLYTTTAAGNARVITSVAVITMPGQDEAIQLKGLADADGTGNVNDLLKDGTASISGAPGSLADGKYRARVSGNQVTIVLSAFFDRHSDDRTLTRVDIEALDLTAQLG